MNETKIKIALWLAHMYSQEGDAITYAYPPGARGTPEEAAELYAAQDAAWQHAEKLNGGELDNAQWRAALAAFAPDGI